LSYRGQTAHLMGDHAAALGHYSQALALSREIKDRRGEAVVLNNLGLLQQARGELDQAEQHFQQALAINTELNERRAMASNLSNLGALSEKRGRRVEARGRYEQALALDKETEARPAIEADLMTLGRLSEEDNRPEEAMGYYERAYRGYLALRHVPRALEAGKRLVRAAGAAGRNAEAAAYQAELNALPTKP
ncbi:MAG: tetratricopeptide repeat protein, partial [Nitrospirota bacterium]